MLAANAYVMRLATDEDTDALNVLAVLDSSRPLTGPVLLGEIDGAPAAAVSLADGRAIGDPFRPTAQLKMHLRVRASSYIAHERTPSLRDRLRAGVRVPAASLR